MSVDFVNRSVVKRPSSRVTLTSRNAMDLLDHSAVNSIFECMLLICLMNSTKSSWPCGQIYERASLLKALQQGKDFELESPLIAGPRTSYI